MNKRSGIIKFFKISLLSFLMVSGFHSCDTAEDLFEGVTINIDWDIIWSKINVIFKDANTGDFIGGENYQQVTVYITGEAADAVLDISGLEKDYYKSNNGFLSLGINPNLYDFSTSGNPARFNIVASADGYMPVSQGLTISENGTVNVTVFMASVASPPEGVSIITTENIGMVENGVLQEELTLKTEGNEACIIIPQGLKMVDESGTVLNGTLDIRLAYYNSKSDGALATFPGGLISRLERYGDVIDGTFFPAGLVSIEIRDRQGRKAKYFEQQTLQLIMTLPAGTFNPETQAAVLAGDEIPVQSYDPETGVWKYHQTTGISISARGDFEVSTYVPHLSWWSFDWFVGNYCNSGIDLVFKGDFGECDNITIDGIIRKKVDDTFLKYISLNVSEDSSVHVTNAPKGVPVYIEWLLTENCSNCFTDPAFNPLQIEDLCSAETYEVPLVCFKPNTTAIVIEVTGYCADRPDMIVRPSFGCWHRPIDNFCWRYAVMQNGYSSICDVVKGETYIVGTYYDNIWYEWQIIISNEETYQLQLNLSDKVCSELF